MTIPNREFRPWHMWLSVHPTSSDHLIYASGGGFGAPVGPRRCEAQHGTGSGLGKEKTLTSHFV